MITLEEISKLGDKDPKWGQKYWGKATNEDTEVYIMFSSRSEFSVGDQISYEESEQKESGKGTPYLALKKVKKVQTDLPDSKSQQTVSTQATGLTYEQGQEIIRLLKKLVNEPENVDLGTKFTLDDVPMD